MENGFHNGYFLAKIGFKGNPASREKDPFFFFFFFLGPVIILNAGRVAATATVANVSDYKTRMEFRHWFYWHSHRFIIDNREVVSWTL